MSLELILASASPRRKELLEQLGISFCQKSVEIDETPYKQEIARDYVMRMAREKADVAWGIWGGAGRIILAADTTVVVGSKTLGKPLDFQDFGSMMRLLSGREHQVLTSVIVKSGQKAEFALSETRVHFCVLNEDDIEWYWQSGEPQDKAGGYGIQGLGARFVKKIDGSYSGVVGLPLFETAEILFNFGILANRA
ncbi:MAG: Maf family protein [Pseudomonadales bacterium]